MSRIFGTTPTPSGAPSGPKEPGGASLGLQSAGPPSAAVGTSGSIPGSAPTSVLDLILAPRFLPETNPLMPIPFSPELDDVPILVLSDSKAAPL